MSRIAEVIEGVAGPASSVQAAKYAIGFANFAGLGAALFFLMLLAISNDLSLRTLKENAPLEVSAEMDACSVRADRGPRHCLSIDIEVPRPWVSRLRSGHGPQLLLVKSLALSRFNGG
jgi:hypothetical protein